MYEEDPALKIDNNKFAPTTYKVQTWIGEQNNGQESSKWKAVLERSQCKAMQSLQCKC